MRKASEEAFAAVPMRTVGPVRITGPVLDDAVTVPLATFESPLWPSVNRGARVSRESGGIRVVILDDRMTRSVLLEAPGAIEAADFLAGLRGRRAEMEAATASTSRFAKLIDVHAQVAGNLLFLRFEFTTGDAAGHNMATKAAEGLMNWALGAYPALRYVSVSGNYCTDKKVSAVNGILGRGKSVVADVLIPDAVCRTVLKTTPEKIVEINIKKNLIGTMLAGGLRTANAHYANMLLAFYLATGQDAANIVEGSQGFVHAEVRPPSSPGTGGGDLYFSASIPNVIVGTVGSGKELDFVARNLALLGCDATREPGANARRLAAICGAVVLCGEISLLAAQTNPGELMKAHVAMERRHAR
jgi:hydroxymethylglutaryl-CoA reductase (NADPH)